MVDLLVISEDSKSIKKIKKIIDRYASGSYKIVIWHPEIQNFFSETNFEFHNICEYINLSKIEERGQVETALELIDKISNHPLGSSTFGEVFNIRNVSLSEITAPVLLLYYLGPLIKDIELIKSILDTERPKRLILIWSDDVFLKLFSALAKKEDLDFHYILLRKRLLNKLKRVFKQILLPFLTGVAVYLKIIKMKCKKMMDEEVPENNSQKKILFLSSTAAQLTGILPVAMVLNKDSRVFASVLISRPHQEVNELRKNSIQFEFSDDYLKLNLLKQIKKDLRLYKNYWKLINDNDEALKEFQYEGLPLWPFLKPIFNYLLFNPFSSIGKNLELANHILENNSYGLIVYTDEVDIFTRIMLILAKIKDIPILRIQYGEMALYPADWLYCLAEKIAVSGDWARDILIKLGIDSQRIVITGQPRFDKLIKGYGPKPDIAQQVKFRNKTKLVLFASAYHSDRNIAGNFGDFLMLDEYIILLRDIYSSLKEIPDIQVIVKPHHNPFDSIGIHRSVIEELNIIDKIIFFPKNSNISDLIKICDLLVTSWGSTVVAEAVCLDKPIVTVNLTGRTDKIPHTERGVVLGAYRKEDILQALKRALEDKDTLDKLREGRMKFIQDFLYRLDGNASERIADLTREMYWSSSRFNKIKV